VNKALGTITFVLLTVLAGATPLWTSDFESGSPDGWKPRGTSEQLTVVLGGHTGASSLAITGRTTTWQGPTHALAPSWKPGSTYRIAVWVRYARGPQTRAFNLSAELGYQDASAPHQYKNLVSVAVNRGEWGQIVYTYTVPADPTLALVEVYVESPYKADNQATPDDTVDFQIDDVAVEAVAEALRPVPQQDIPRLRDVLAGSLLVGTAVSPDQVNPADPHFRLLTRHFGAIVPGNAMKPEALQPQEGRFTFGQADLLADYADRTGTKLRGHTLVWHQQTPSWFFTDPKDPKRPASKELLLSRLNTHIAEVVGHYRGQVSTWDVVNEVVSDRSGLRTGDEGSLWYAIAGADYIDAAFRAARAADPDAELAINDYNLESSVAKRDALYELVKGMKARGVPVDVVGLQGHISIYGPSVDQFRQAIRKFATLGVKVQVTELDLSIYSGASEPAKQPSADILALQARRYAELFTMFREEARAGRLELVMLWGSADDDTWLDNFPVPGRLDAPLLFDRQLQAKPAFWAVVGAEAGKKP